MSATTTREFKPKGKPPKHRRKLGWLPGDQSGGHIMTRNGWVPLSPEDVPAAAPRARLWVSVLLVLAIAAAAVWMGLHG